MATIVSSVYLAGWSTANPTSLSANKVNIIEVHFDWTDLSSLPDLSPINRVIQSATPAAQPTFQRANERRPMNQLFGSLATPGKKVAIPGLSSIISAPN
jgi:hypothetical protein